MGCYIVAALVLVTTCNDSWIFSRHTRSPSKRCPYPKKLKSGKWQKFVASWLGMALPADHLPNKVFPTGWKGTLRMDNGTAFLPNDFYPLEKETFRLYYTSTSIDQQTIDVHVQDSFGQLVQLTFSFYVE